jgi:hypothetical protein
MFIEARLETLANPRRNEACHEPRAQKIIAVGEDVEQAGRILLFVKTSSDVFWDLRETSDDSEEDSSINEECTAMKAQSGAMQKPESWLNHDPQALLSLRYVRRKSIDVPILTQVQCHAYLRL